MLNLPPQIKSVNVLVCDCGKILRRVEGLTQARLDARLQTHFKTPRHVQYVQRNIASPLGVEVPAEQPVEVPVEQHVVVPQNDKVNCPCGSVINPKSIFRHKKTKKHIEYLDNLPLVQLAQVITPQIIVPEVVTPQVVTPQVVVAEVVDMVANHEVVLAQVVEP